MLLFFFFKFFSTIINFIFQCLIPCCSRLRKKIIEKHISEDLSCLGYQYWNEISDSSDTSDSESSFDAGDSSKADKSNRKRKPDEKNYGRKCAKGCTGDKEVRKNKSKTADKSKSKRWTFCLNLKKPSSDSRQSRDSKSVKKSKRSRQDRGNDSETHCAYFKSCSCTNVRKRSRRKRSEPSRMEMEGTKRVDKRPSKKQKKCPCKIIEKYDNNIVCYDPRNVQPDCKCCARRTQAAARRCCE